MKNINQEKAITLLPEMKSKILRLVELQSNSSPKLVFSGKYNHGKSFLINALTGSDFKVADKRETVCIASHHNDTGEWIDTPGIDADVAGKDDELAIETVVQKADVIFFVHSVTVGELDKVEIDYLKRLDTLGRRIFVVLSQIDNTTGCLKNIFIKIEKQVNQVNSGIHIMKVSAQRALHSEPLIQKQSGLNELLTMTVGYCKSIEKERAYEKATLLALVNAARCQRITELALQKRRAQAQIDEVERSLVM